MDFALYPVGTLASELGLEFAFPSLSVFYQFLYVTPKKQKTSTLTLTKNKVLNHRTH